MALVNHDLRLDAQRIMLQVKSVDRHGSGDAEGRWRSSNDADLNVPESQVRAVSNDQLTTFIGTVTMGTLVWDLVRYPEVVIEGSAFEVSNVVANAGGTSSTVTVAGRSGGSPFTDGAGCGRVPRKGCGASEDSLDDAVEISFVDSHEEWRVSRCPDVLVSTLRRSRNCSSL